MTDQEFVLLIKRNKKIIYRAYNTYCSNYSEEDLVQEIILEAYKSIKIFKNNCSFTTWLYRIARNVCISFMRKQKQIPKYEQLEKYADVLEYCDGKEELDAQLQHAMRYNTVIDSIESQYKQAFQMYLEGISYKEMEAQTGINENQLRVQMHRIKKRLQLRYGK